MVQNIKICILSELAYSLLSGHGIRGGAELQMVILARELIKRSYDVSFITFEMAGSRSEVIDGIKSYNLFGSRSHGYTYLYPKNIHKLLKTLKKIDADIYIQRGTSPLTGIISFFAILNNKKFIYSTSSDNDVSKNLDLKSFNDLKNLFFRFGVTHSNLVIIQTNHQKNLLKKKLGTEGKVIKNFYPFLYNAQKQNDSSEEKILWIGRMRKEKRPDLFLDLAKSLPEVKFRMIGGPSSVHPNFYYEIKEAADKINNLDFIGFVPHNQIGKYYNETTLLINTSPSEGFPNTFLEAWGNGVPVVSLGFDPDEIICTNNLGLHSKTYNQMIEDVKYLLKNEQLRKEMGANSRNYIEENHNLNKLVEEYEQVFKFLMKKNNNTQKLAY